MTETPSLKLLTIKQTLMDFPTKSIKLNIGGTIFETTKDTLSKSTYFDSFFKRWYDSKVSVPFIDRSPHIFKHVLSLMRDSYYRYPEKYLNELVFYGVDKPKNIDADKTFYKNVLTSILNASVGTIILSTKGAGIDPARCKKMVSKILNP